MHSANILPPPSPRAAPLSLFAISDAVSCHPVAPPSWPFSLAVCCSFRATGALRLAAFVPRVASLASRFVAAPAPPRAVLSACSFRVLRAVIVILVLWLVREASNGLLLG